MRTFNITPDPSDPHFSEVRIIGSKGKILREHRILTGDSDQWRSFLKGQGYNDSNDDERRKS